MRDIQPTTSPGQANPLASLLTGWVDQGPKDHTYTLLSVSRSQMGHALNQKWQVRSGQICILALECTPVTHICRYRIKLLR